jgi:hypothetical protein
MEAVPSTKVTHAESRKAPGLGDESGTIFLASVTLPESMHLRQLLGMGNSPIGGRAPGEYNGD